MKLPLGYVSFLAVVMMTFSGCAMIGPGEKAVHTVFGSPSSESGSGITLWIPFIYGLQTFDLRVQKHVIETTASSKDLQPLDSHIAVNWRIDPKNLTEFYKDVGDEDDAVQKLLTPAVNEVFKASTAKMTAENIVGRRTELKTEIDNQLGERLKRYGISVDDVSIMDVKFSNQFIEAIEAKQIAEQQKEQAQYVADKAIKDAEAMVNRAKGQAESQRLLQASLTPAMIQKMYIEKWNGVLPTVQGSGQNTLLNMKVAAGGASGE